MKNTTLSEYTYNIAQGFRLGDEYMRFSVEALIEDKREIEMRRKELNIEKGLEGGVKMKLIKICEERQKIMITQLVGLAEEQRKIYDNFKTQPEFQNELKESYRLHQRELELLIRYQTKRNENETR